ncbi:FAD-binding oxidoreductase [Halogranum rubrum]|uniref:FAD linked oxidase domain protein n=1 Tax=Halogranum salarium B-1 TaxID=1210908 RepID=J3JFH4_9EURY|nr:FAD-binding oxidoreductase [Halogranum salarium]EJN59259.1 FAD linked oxidase domain protein [Halogranum salarium B-1]
MKADKTAIDGDAFELFRARFHGQLVQPGDAEYDSARQVWNGMVDKHPAVIARCTGVADVVAAVTFAREQGLLTAIRGGGHNVAGLAMCDGGLVIDLSELRSVHVDPERKTARVEAGATWGDVDRETQTFGLIAPGGVVSDTGVAGLTLGGGYGHTRRKYGLTSDSVRTIDLVTAAGEFLTASPTEHEDLFWALRGGGGNFGVVTAFEFDLYELGPEVMTVGTMYPLEDASTLIRRWRDFVADAVDETSSTAVLWRIPDLTAFPEPLRGRPVFIPSSVYAGPVEEGAKAMQLLRELGTPIVDPSGPQTYLELQTKYDPFFPAGDRYYWKSRYLDDLSGEAIDTMIEAMTKCPSSRTMVAIRALGGQIARVDPSETAFTNRDSPFMISIDSTWTDPNEDDENVQWTQELWDAMAPYATEQIYFNFDMNETGEDVRRATFGENHERLIEVKNKYDPENRFRVNQNIRPTVKPGS